MTKQQLRNIYIEKRLKLKNKDKIASDDIIFNKITENKRFIESDCILTYVSTKTEVDTIKLIEYSLKIGKTVAVPKCDTDSDLMKFYRISSTDDLEKGYFNILEPNRFCIEQFDFGNAVCIVPGLCFDSKGFRLGYGRGYYDRFLTEHPVYSIGLCYDSFLIDRMPAEAFDKQVDEVITDRLSVKGGDCLEQQ